MITRKQLWKELTMLEATVKELASRTKEQLDGLRADMTTAGKIQDANTINIEALQKLLHGWATDFEDFGKRVRNLETCGVIRDKAIAALVLACGLRDGKFEKAYSQIEQERGEFRITKKSLQDGKVQELSATCEASAPQPEESKTERRHYAGLQSAESMAKRTGKTYKDIKRIAREKQLYITTRKGHAFVREADELYYR